jgi:hypothetical protein
MSLAGLDQVGERPLEDLVQNASQQAVVLAREQLDVARQELLARASQALPGAAMVGGAAVLGALASGSGTAALVLLLARRPGASAAALGVTGAYAGAGAFLARQGLARLRQVGPHESEVPVSDEPVENAEEDSGSTKRRAKSAARSARPIKSTAKSTTRSARPIKSAVKSAGQQGRRVKPASKASSSRRGASPARAPRTPRRAP